ncbi:hypothetical protein [Dokdonella sp.]|uniref:hypothetical protein n=1 Tax=Dokdonella sp. TaxID=2291710 RepID=UPI0031C91144|nr:hypothetical protein [Dokdonella sp.]
MRTWLTAPGSRRFVKVAGVLLVLVAGAFLVRRALALGGALGTGLADIPPCALASAFAVYVLGALLLALAWWRLVGLAAGRALPARPLLVGHLRAQGAKYLPGNVFHLAFRHVSARRLGVGHAALALALGLESLLVITAAAMLGLGMATDPRVVALAPWARHLAWLLPILLALAWWGSGAVARRTGQPAFRPGRRARGLAVALGLYLGMFVLSALSLRLLAADPDALPLLAWCGWLALAWMIGYVTPGAPAGLGLREAVLVLGLGPVFGEAGALVLALAYRLISVAADALLALLGLALRGPRSPADPPAPDQVAASAR